MLDLSRVVLGGHLAALALVLDAIDDPARVLGRVGAPGAVGAVGAPGV